MLLKIGHDRYYLAALKFHSYWFLNKLNLNIGHMFNYLLEDQTSKRSFKILDNYESNNGESLGKVYETKIFDLLKSILNENGYEIVKPTEAETQPAEPNLS